MSDSPSVALRIGDQAFLEFLVAYIGDSVSLLADLACMLLSNLTKFEPIAARLLNLEVEDRPFFSYLSPLDLQISVSGMSADPSEPNYEERKRASEAATKRIAASVNVEPAASLPALVKLIRAFEEGATVESSFASGADMRARVEATRSEDKPVEMDDSGRPHVRRRSHCNFLASVFANVSVLPRGREFFVTPIPGADARVPDAYPVGRIMVYTEHGDLIRRGGVISAMKNILFVKHAHRLMLAPAPGELDFTRPAPELDILPYLLMPLISGAELAKVDLDDQEQLPEVCQLVDESKPREKDSALRLMLVESLLLLCTSLYGRESLRKRGAYIVVREAHLAEPKEEIAEAIVRLVNLLKRDESAESMRETDVNVEVSTEGDENDDDLVIEEL